MAKKRGRKPTPITPEVMYEKAKEGATKAEIASEFNIRPETVSRLQEQNPQLAQAYEEGRQENREQFKERIIPKILTAFERKLEEGSDAAIIFGMKAIVGFKEASTVEHTGPDGGPISMLHENMTEEQLQERAKVIASEMKKLLER